MPCDPVETDCPVCGAKHAVDLNLLRLAPSVFGLCQACHDVRSEAQRKAEAVAVAQAEAEARSRRCADAMSAFSRSVPAGFEALTEAQLLAIPGVSPRIADALRWKWSKEKPWLVLAGTSGTGKTSAMWLLARRLAERGKTSLVYAASRFAAEAVAAARDGDSLAMQNRLRRAPLLVFDDIEKGVYRDRAQEMLFHALDVRYADRSPTIFTTNQDWEGLEKLWPDSDHAVAAIRRMRDMSTTIPCTV